MDFTSIVLVQIAVFYCLATLLPTSRSNSSLKIAAIVVLTILSMSWYFMPDLMVKIGIGSWIVLVLIPMWMMHRIEALVGRSQYLAASRLAKWLRWMAPTDGMWNYHHLLEGIAIAQTGQIDRADEIFDRYQPKSTPQKRSRQQLAIGQSISLATISRAKPGLSRHQGTSIGRTATAILYRATDRWAEYVSWVQERLTPEQLNLDRGTTWVYYLRALAETGDLRSCIAEVNKIERDQQMNTQNLNILKLYILAFCGRVEAVTLACQSLLTMYYPPDVHLFWISTADLAAGKIKTATQDLAKLQQTSQDSCIQQDITWRLSQPLPDLSKLKPLDWEIVHRIEATVVQDARYGSQTPSNASTPVTNLLIAINVVVFCAELFWQYRSGDQEFSLIPWGGLVAPLVVTGQWWRIVSANFLHLGGLHLGMNMVALLYLGKFVEYRLGSWRYFLAYLLAGLGSMATITYVDTRWMTDPHITVGASGAIMGMLGVMGAIHLRGWRKAKVAAAGRQFQAVLFSVGFQLVFDITNGHTSIVGHFSGLIIGFLVGLLLLQLETRDELIS